MELVSNIISQAIRKGLRMKATEVHSDILNLAIDSYNVHGQMIWDAWPWDDSQLDVFEVSPVSLIITMPAAVGAIRAIRKADTSEGGSYIPVMPKDPTMNFRGTDALVTEEFIYLASNASGYKRIQVEGADTDTYEVLALANFTRVDTTTYLTTYFKIDKAVPAIIEYVADSLRNWTGAEPHNLGVSAMQVALANEETVQNKDHRITPAHPQYSEVGNWR